MKLTQNNLAGAAFLSTAGFLNDVGAMNLQITGNLRIEAAGEINLGATAGTTIEVGGLAELVAGEGIFIGEPATVHFGELNFQAAPFVLITEDSGTHLTGDLITDSLNLNSAGYVTDSDTVSYNLFYGRWETPTGILLGDTAGIVIDMCFAEFFAGDFAIVDEPANVTMTFFNVTAPVSDINVDDSC